ncbi:hypothetical protein OC195_18955 [Priestia flexa]|nr:hypothetical protein OC195_18955 [Priestia flexa]
MDDFRKSTAPFYFADYIWKDKNGQMTYGMLLTNRYQLTTGSTTSIHY